MEMLKHGDNFVVILENQHSPAAAKVQLCIGIVLSIFRHNQMSMTVFHAAFEMAVHISRTPVCNRCKKIFESTISKTEKAVEATRKNWNNLAQRGRELLFSRRPRCEPEADNGTTIKY